MNTLIFAVSIPLWLLPQPQSPTPSPTEPATSAAPENFAALSIVNQTLIAAAWLSLTPEALAASGYSETETTSLVAKIRQRNVLAMLQARCAASALQPPAPVSPEQNIPNAAAIRAAILASAIPNDPAAKSDRLGECAAGLAYGLPAHIAVACTSDAERNQAAAALLAESRAQRLNRPMAARHTAILTSIRARPAYTAAIQNTSARLSSMQEIFALPPHVEGLP